MEQLFTALKKFAFLNEDLRFYLEGALKTTPHKKGDILVEIGSVCRRIGFIEKGLIRGYRYKRNVERTSYFLGEGDIVISIRSFFTQKPARERIEALEDCIIHSITYDELKYGYKTYPAFQEHRAEILQKYYLLSEEREDMRQLRTYERFLYLMDNQPHLAARIEDKYLASYLGISPYTFSRHKSRYTERGAKKPR
jgi:CRP-like cAMP-binding protein